MARNFPLDPRSAYFVFARNSGGGLPTKLKGISRGMQYLHTVDSTDSALSTQEATCTFHPCGGSTAVSGMYDTQWSNSARRQPDGTGSLANGKSGLVFRAKLGSS